MTNDSPIENLLAIMAKLRDPNSGCPWDIEQNFTTIAPYTIEEAYEVADAIQRGSMSDLRDELGDLLLQVVFHAQMAKEADAFDFDDVARAISAKMISRHPHVFGDEDVHDADGQTQAWETYKDAERAAKTTDGGTLRVLDDVTLALPALMRAEKLTKRAGRVGFDWPDVDQVFDKLAEETAELKQELSAATRDQDRLEDEVGDMLFVVANLARKLGVDPEVALRRTNDKFVRRFNAVEDGLQAIGKTPKDADLAEMDALWNAAKQTESR